METTASTGKRAVWYIVGLNLIAAAVVLNVRYNVGVAAFSSVMYAISEIYRISLGTASIICYLIFVVMQCILSRRITLTYLLEIPLSFAFGVLTDVYDWLIPVLPFALPTRLLCFTLTMFVTAAGVFLCVKSKMVLTPTDGIVNTISEVFHLRFSAVKNSFDLSMVAISALLCIPVLRHRCRNRAVCADARTYYQAVRSAVARKGITQIMYFVFTQCRYRLRSGF